MKTHEFTVADAMKKIKKVFDALGLFFDSYYTGFETIIEEVIKETEERVGQDDDLINFVIAHPVEVKIELMVNDELGTNKEIIRDMMERWGK